MTEAHALFDEAAIRAKQDRSKRYGEDGLFLHQQVAGGLIDRRFDIARTLEDIAVYGGRGLLSAQRLGANGAFAVERCEAQLVGQGCIASPDLLPLQELRFDAFFSLLSLHNVDDIPGALIQINRCLKPDGVFMGALFSSGTLDAVRTAFLEADAQTTGGASPRVIPLMDVRDAGGLLQRAGFVMPVADTEVIEVRYGDPLSLLHDLRAMGETNPLKARSRTVMRRETLGIALAKLDALRGEDGKIPIRFSITYLTGWAPGPDQPKPLAPGSAKTRLADALGTQETALKR
ncbi:MAG: methyltransferase domain-containing protein [Pseudomonadota bacterium]